MTITHSNETTPNHRTPAHTYKCAECLQTQPPKPKKRIQASLNTLERYLCTPRSAYYHWSAPTTQHNCPTPRHGDEGVENFPAVSSYEWQSGGLRDAFPRKYEVKKRAVFEEDEEVGEKEDEVREERDQVKQKEDEWKIVSEDSRRRIWMNSEGVRVTEKDAWWKSVVNF